MMMTNHHLCHGLNPAAVVLSMLLVVSPAVGDKSNAEDTTSYRRLARYLAAWPMLDAPEKEIALPGDGEAEVVPLRLQWSSDQLEFAIRGVEDPVPFLEVPESNASGLGIDRQGEIGRFPVQLAEGLEAILIQSVYSPGNVRYFTETEAQWTVCVVERHGVEVDSSVEFRVGACRSAHVDRTSFVWEVGHAPEARWMHVLVDSDGGRGFSSESIPLLRDHDGDGYTDLVLWQRFEVSAAAVSQETDIDDSAEFELNHSKLWLLRFDPQVRAFAEPVVISGPAPAEELAAYQALLGSL